MYLVFPDLKNDADNRVIHTSKVQSQSVLRCLGKVILQEDSSETNSATWKTFVLSESWEITSCKYELHDEKRKMHMPPLSF